MTINTRANLRVKRIGPTLMPDRSRVLMRPFRPTTDEIAARIVSLVMNLREQEVARILDDVLGEFGNRHKAVEKFFLNRFKQVRDYIAGKREPSSKRKALIGSYFTHEYSPESAALFNPSIVPHPDQSDLPPGALRFILSLRATGEGHISSITFRAGVISAQHRITLTPPVAFSAEPERVPNAAYDTALFARKLEELGVRNKSCRSVLDQLGDSFTLDQLRCALAAEQRHTNEN